MIFQPADLLIPQQLAPAHPTPRIALLIDADNASPAQLPAMLAHLAPHGDVTIRRAYADWGRQAHKNWATALQTHAFRQIQQSAPTKGKNATDIALVIEAMELFYTQRPDAIAIASSDADFTPLALRLREYGVAVFGMGEAKAPAHFRQACSAFLELNAAPKPSPAPDLKPTKAEAPAPRTPPYPINALRKAVTAQIGADGWADLGAVGTQLGQAKQIHPKTYGCGSFASLFKATGQFETCKNAKGRTCIRPKS